MRTFKCICCGAKIKPLYPEHLDALKPQSGMWDDGTVELITMPYGSILDMNKYLIGICDNCIIKKEKEGVILDYDVYYENQELIEERKKKINKIRRLIK